MSGSLVSFEFSGQGVRVVMRDSEPWFVARDVCAILELTNITESMKRLDEDEFSSTEVIDSAGRPQETQIVSEPGLYALVLGSRKPEAKAFKRWVTHEVVPSIRKNGMYAVDALLDDPDRLLQVVAKWADERKARQAAEARLVEQQPLVTFAEACLTSKDSILVRELAKIATKNGVNIGEKRLYERLREWGLILRGKTEPTQKAMDAGYFEVLQRPIQTPYGEHLATTTKVTPRGQVYIIERLRSEAKAGGKLPAAETVSDHPITTTQAGATKH